MISPVSAPQRGQRPSSARSGPQLLLVQRGDLLDGLLANSAIVHEATPVLACRARCRRAASPSRRSARARSAGAPPSIVMTWRPFGVAMELPADALDVLAADQRLDDLGARGRRAEAAILHRLAQLLVGRSSLARGLHRRQQRRLVVAGRRLRLLRLLSAATQRTVSPCSSGGSSPPSPSSSSAAGSTPAPRRRRAPARPRA